MFGLHSALFASLLVAAAPVAVQDVSFRVMNPSAHAQLSAALPSRSSDQALLARVKQQTATLLAFAGLEGEVSGRVKSLLSTHQKMERKNLGLADIADRIALRVYVDTVDECYAAHDLIHQAFPAVEGEQDDYIANPKANGYQSLHTAVLVNGQTVEFQVRTHEMHEAAENGAAAHWKYKLA